MSVKTTKPTTVAETVDILADLKPTADADAASIPGFGRLDEERAKSIAAMQQYSDLRAAVEDIPIGFWTNVPPQMGGPIVSPKPMPPQWHFLRMGVKGHAATFANEQNYKRMGYRAAPPGVQCSGFVSDHNNGSYVCAPPEVYMKGRALKMVAKRMLDSHADELAKSLGGFGLKGVTAEVTYADEGTATADEIDAKMREGRRRR